MAILYVRSTDGSDSDNGSTWALAKATLTGAFAAAAAGDTIYVSQAHSESTAASITLTSPGTAASPCKVICGNDGAEPPTAVATTGVIATTGTNSSINFAGFAYYEGLSFSAGTASNSSILMSPTTPSFLKFVNCKHIINTTGSGSVILMGAVSTNTDDFGVEFVNTTVQFGATTQLITVRCPFDWRNTPSAVAGSTFPAALFKSGSAGNSGTVRVTGVDLSALTSGKSLVDVSAGNWGEFTFTNCKLGSSVGLTTGTNPGQGGALTTFINCDSGDTNYKFTQSSYRGTITQETTIVRSSGATDGTTAISRKMVSSANTNLYFPLVSRPIFFWNETVGSVAISVPVITDNVTLTNAEAWIEVEYLGTSGFPLASDSSDRISTVLTTAANQTTDATSSWTTTGLTTPVKQTLDVTVSAAEKGMIAVRVVLAKASTTMYYDPFILPSSSRQYQTFAGFINEPPTSGSGGLTQFSRTFGG